MPDCFLGSLCSIPISAVSYIPRSKLHVTTRSCFHQNLDLSQGEIMANNSLLQGKSSPFAATWANSDVPFQPQASTALGSPSVEITLTIRFPLCPSLSSFLPYSWVSQELCPVILLQATLHLRACFQRIHQRWSFIIILFLLGAQ